MHRKATDQRVAPWKSSTALSFLQQGHSSILVTAKLHRIASGSYSCRFVLADQLVNQIKKLRSPVKVTELIERKTNLQDALLESVVQICLTSSNSVSVRS